MYMFINLKIEGQAFTAPLPVPVITELQLQHITTGAVYIMQMVLANRAPGLPSEEMQVSGLTLKA